MGKEQVRQQQIAVLKLVRSPLASEQQDARFSLYHGMGGVWCYSFIIGSRNYWAF
jgi:hypothetical protein